MIIVRTVLQAKFGMGGHLAAAAVEGMEAIANAFGDRDPHWRVLTDLTGEFDTVTMEAEVESLAQWEAMRAEMVSNPAFADTMLAMNEMSKSGSMTFLNIEGQG